MVAVCYNQPDMSYRREVGENQSSLKYILKSPAHYQASKRKSFIPTVFMEMGSALHCKVLEGDEQFAMRYALKPSNINFTTKEGKEWKQQHKGKTILTNTDKEAAWDSVHGMAIALKTLPWFDPSQPDYRKFNELSIYWDADNIACKARLDRLVDDGDRLLVLDLKTTDSVEPHIFERKVFGPMNYIFQAAWYAEAAELAYGKPAGFVFIAVERVPPFSVGIFEVSDEMMQEGRAQIREARRILDYCNKTNEWPGPCTQHNQLNLPQWYQSPLSLPSPEFTPLF